MHRSENSIEISTERDAARPRLFVDTEGTRWQVYEQEFSDYDRRRGSSLIFAAETAVRRVRDYPPNWRELSDAELTALSWKV
jgi:hypothetical protein